MTTRRPSVLSMRNLCYVALIVATLLPGLALGDGPESESKAPADKPAAEKADANAPEEEPAADAPKPAEEKPAAKKPEPKPAEEKPAAEKPDPKPAEEEPAAKKPEPKPAEEKPAAEKPELKPEAPEAKAEAPEPTPVEVDLSLMGEFVGTVATDRDRFEQIGLQVRCTGNGTFEAAQHLGGLPKQPGQEPPTMLVGRRNGDFLVLSGGPWAVFVEPERCFLIDRDARRVGRLDRVRRESPTMGAKPPEGAMVLFDGSGTEHFTVAEVTDDGLLKEGAAVNPLFHDFNLHAEFLVPYMPTGRGQGRGNSGFYLQSRYEVQVLDSFALIPRHDDCGALYKFRAPDVNMSFPPLVWQTYDIRFTSPRWNADGTKRKNARITVWHNGVKIHDNVELPDKTGSGSIEEPVLLPIRIQDHGDPVRFRNVWIIDRGDAPPVRFPPRPERARDGKRR